jgi:hypothetical protein
MIKSDIRQFKLKLERAQLKDRTVLLLPCIAPLVDMFLNASLAEHIQYALPHGKSTYTKEYWKTFSNEVFFALVLDLSNVCKGVQEVQLRYKRCSLGVQEVQQATENGDMDIILPEIRKASRFEMIKRCEKRINMSGSFQTIVTLVTDLGLICGKLYQVFTDAITQSFEKSRRSAKDYFGLTHDLMPLSLLIHALLCQS